MHLFTLLVFIVAIVVAADFSRYKIADGTVINVDRRTAHWELVVDSKVWLSSSDIYVHTDAKILSVNKKSITLQNVKDSTGEDDFGKYTSLTFEWKLGDTGLTFSTIFQVYQLNDMIIFHTTLPQGLPNTAFGGASANNELTTCFPSIQKNGGLLPRLNTLYWKDLWGQGEINHGVDKFTGGINGGVPLVIFDDSFRTVVVSPLNNFMVGFQSATTYLQGDIGCGIQGRVQNIPANTTHSTIIYTGHGIANTLQEWGKKLLQKSNKIHVKDRTDLDISSTHLGYYTDNGAYYYYQTESGKNYEDTLKDVKQFHVQEGYAFKYYQIDSWWYYKGIKDGVKTWEARPDIFPNGLEKLSNALDAPFVAHNRYWASDNTYQQKYKFVKESTLSLPQSLPFWNDLLKQAKQNKIVVYEQDWLVDQTRNMNITQNNMDAARTWLTDMGKAAEMNGMLIQYCMPLPMHFLQSTEIKPVVQIRTSDDYETMNYQWSMARNNLLAWSLGMMPFKDTFYTTAVQPGSRKDKWEPTPELQVLVAALSAGPVGPGDKIGYHNKTRIMATCNNDGLLVKPDRPAFPIDRMFLPINQRIGQVWSTVSTVSGLTTTYLFAANMTAPVNVTKQDLGLDEKHTYYAYNYYTRTAQVFGKSIALEFGKPVSVNQTIPIQYFVIAQASDQGVVPLGDLSKYITISQQRVKSLTFSQIEFVQGKEEFHVGFIVDGQVITKQCTRSTAKLENKKIIC